MSLFLAAVVFLPMPSSGGRMPDGPMLWAMWAMMGGLGISCVGMTICMADMTFPKLNCGRIGEVIGFVGLALAVIFIALGLLAQLLIWLTP